MSLKIPVLIMALILSSCSQMQVWPDYDREPAGVISNCSDVIKNFFTKKTNEETLEAGLEKALVDKKLLTYTNKFVTIQHPKMDWLNRTRASLNRSIKNWNNNKYPAFYIFNDEEVVPQAKQYFHTIHSMVSPDIAVDPTASKNLELVNGWFKSFENYQSDIDKLLEERISLQYNLTLLKKLKFKDETRDVKFLIKRDGKLVEEIVTLRKKDKDQAYQIKRLKSEIDLLDGTVLKNGKIKDRIIRQAMLFDMITIVQREFEYSLKNIDTINPELVKEMEKINSLLKVTELNPTTYGVYRITNKVFIREVAALSRIDVTYKKFIESPTLKIKEIVDAFIKNRPINNLPDKTEPEKIGILKRVYAKISSVTMKQASVGFGIVAVAGIGFDRYFTLSGSSVVPVTDDVKKEVLDEDRPHAEQLKKTEEEVVKQSEDHSKVIEVEMKEITE